MEPHKKELGTQNGNSALQPSQGVLETSATAVHPENSTVSGNDKHNFNQEYLDPLSGQVTHQPLQAPATQQPPKKKGFQITSVKDPGDGEESADELDESHTSYSDISYSRTTDIDHDQESSASEDTLNTTVQDGVPQSMSGPGTVVTNALDGSMKSGGVKSTTQNVMVNHSQTGQLDLKDNEQKKDLVKSPASTPVVDAKESSLTDKTPSLPHVPQSAQTKAPTKVVGCSSQASHTADTIATTSSVGSKVTASTSGSLAKGGASRVYKVVKRESFQPVKRERARWTCYDYFDSQSPSLAFVAHSASDTRLNFHEHQMHSANNLPASMSATSVPSSSSSYSLQHSDSSSSVYRDSHHSAAIASSVQHSASTSSVNYDLETRKRLTNVKPLNENVEENRRPSLEERTEASGQDVIKSAIQSYVDLNTSEDEGSSARNVRIDNKIEAAMDLVKKHLMLAVRDEVDELKEKIVELQDDNLKMKKENDLLKGVLTPEQYNAVQQVLTKQAITQPQKCNSLQPTQATIPGYNLPIQGIQSLDIAAQTPNQVTPTHQPLATGPTNPTIHHGYAQQPAANTGSIQLQPMHLNPALITAQGSIPILQQQGQQQSANANLAQKPGALPAATTVPSQFQQQQQQQPLYQPVSVPQQPQITQQQMQALLQQQQQQQQQVYPQPPGQQGYQAQAPTLTVGSQQQAQVTQHLPTQPSTYQGQPAALAGSYAPTQTPFQPQPPQARPVGQPATALVMPRQQQQQQVTNVAAGITSPTNTGPALNQSQQTFQAATPTHVTNPAPTYSTFVQTSAVTSGGKVPEPRVTHS